jgi:adenylate cyclase
MAEERVERRLAAVLAADVAGYSRLMGIDEEGTLAALKEHRRAAIDPQIAAHRGRIVKTTGDGLLAEFASAVDAVRCSLDIQRTMAERNAAIAPDRRIDIRIGINVGDIIIDDGDIYGDGVNIAARVEPLAAPGGICIAENAYRQVEGKLALDVSDMGEQRLKNIAQPVRTFGVRLNGSAAPAAGAAPGASKPSIAVLPFTNMSGDPEQEYFCDGMVEEVITGLSRIKWLSVISRNSSFIYKNKPVVMKDVADKLGVRYVLEGGVRKAGNRVRISAQLIDAETGAHLWAEQYDRLLDDVFALQDEITMSVIGAIEPNLRKAETDRVKRQRPSNLNAYDLVLRAMPSTYAAMPKEANIAIPLLEEALKLEPHYGAAHAFMSWCYHARYTRGGLKEDDRLAAVRHARAAVAHGSDDATSIGIAGFVTAMDERDTVTALKLFDRALELSNSNVFALSCSTIPLAYMGKTDLAMERAQRAIRLSPFDSLNFRSYVGLAVVYCNQRKFNEAAAAARSAIDANPSFSNAHAILAAARASSARPRWNSAALREVFALQPGFTIAVFGKLADFDPAMWCNLADAWRQLGVPE